MKSYLSGMPECKFGINDKIVMEAKGMKGGGSLGGGGDDRSYWRQIWEACCCYR